MPSPDPIGAPSGMTAAAPASSSLLVMPGRSAVFGSSVYFWGSTKSRRDSPCPGRLTRRTATVTISAPEASMASRMFSNDGYFPVPTIRRDLNSFPPSHSDVSYIMTPLRVLPSPYPLPRGERGSGVLAASHWMDDLDLVPVRQHRLGVAGPLGHLAVQGYRGELAADFEPGQ